MNDLGRCGVQTGALVVAAGFLLTACGGPALSPKAPASPPHPTGKIAFVNDKDGNLDNQDNDQTIYVMNGDGTGLRQLTTQGSTVDAPAWSPDGTRIAFSCVSGATSQICVMNADGSRMTRLTNGGSNFAPAWSPDGKQIAFMREEGLLSIYVMNSDGSQQTWWASTAGRVARLAWSPDGKQIAYQDQNEKPNSPAQIGLLTLGSSGLAVSVPITSGGDGAPAWSPDGKQLAYVKYTTSPQVYLVNSDGTAERAVTTGSGDHGWPTWAPNAKSLAFEGNGTGTLQVYVIGVDGAGQRLLSTLRGANYAPAWTGPMTSSSS
jgi:TolB protein